MRWPQPPSSTSCGWTPKLSSRVGGKDRRSNGRALIKCWRGRAGWRRPLRYATRPTVGKDAGTEGSPEGRPYDWRMGGKPGVTGSVRFCSLVAGRVEFHPPTFCLLQIFSRMGASLPHETARAAQALTMAGKKGRSGRRKGSLN